MNLHCFNWPASAQLLLGHRPACNQIHTVTNSYPCRLAGGMHGHHVHLRQGLRSGGWKAGTPVPRRPGAQTGRARATANPGIDLDPLLGGGELREVLLGRLGQGAAQATRRGRRNQPGMGSLKRRPGPKNRPGDQISFTNGYNFFNKFI